MKKIIINSLISGAVLAGSFFGTYTLLTHNSEPEPQEVQVSQVASTETSTEESTVASTEASVEESFYADRTINTDGNDVFEGRVFSFAIDRLNYSYTSHLQTDGQGNEVCDVVVHTGEGDKPGQLIISNSGVTITMQFPDGTWDTLTSGALIY